MAPEATRAVPENIGPEAVLLFVGATRQDFYDEAVASEAIAAAETVDRLR
jgi:hypothetical protein